MSSRWTQTEDGCRYDVTTPVEAEIVLPDGRVKHVQPGSYVLFSK